MNETRDLRHGVRQDAGQESSRPRKPYRKPDFQYEKVFETMALSCGKISPTQAQCHFNRKNS